MSRFAALSSSLALSLLVACGSPDPLPPQPGDLVLLDLGGTWGELRGRRGTSQAEGSMESIGTGGGASSMAAVSGAAPAPRNGRDGGPGPTGPGGSGEVAAIDEPVLEDAEVSAMSEDMALGSGLALQERMRSTNRAGEDAGAVEAWKVAAKPQNATALRIGDDEELPLLGVQANAWVEGHRARVVLDLFYFNDRDRQLEGEFVLRLPDGASPYYLAFGGQTDWRAEEALAVLDGDLFFDPPSGDAAPRRHSPDGIRMDREGQWIEPREARVVPREKAAHAYTETVRRQVDPALMEWAGAGVFRARVFPLLPGELHRVVLGYELDLSRVGADLEYVLELPEDVAQVAVDLHVAAPAGVAVEVEPAGAAHTSGGRQEHSWRDPQERSFRVRIHEPGPTFLVGRDGSGDDLFAVNFTPEMEQDAAAGGRSRAVFMLDTSLSSAPDRFPIWLALLEEVLTANRDSIAEFAVLEMDVERRWWREGFSPNTPADVADFLAHADGIALEGATDLAGALAEAARPGWAAGGAPWDLFLLSDAAPTWGEDDPWVLSRALGSGGADALFAYATGLAGTDRRVLDHLSRETGGAVFTVNGAGDVAVAAIAHRARPYRLLGARVPGGRDLLLRGRPGTLYPGQVLALVGRGAPPAGATIELDLERDGVPSTLHTRIAHALDSDLARRAFGAVAVSQLEELGDAVGDEARAYATHFRVPGATCSLLMLETEEDYERFEIVPEDDASVVRTTDTERLVTETLRSRADDLGDPRRALLAHLARLEGMPGLSFELPEALTAVMADLPGATFVVSPEPMRTMSRAAADVPAELAAALAAGEPDYDALQAAAAARREDRGAADALRLLSSLVELNPGDGVAARDVAYSAMEMGLPGHAYHLLRRAAVNRPWEPQTYHAMARCLDAAGNRSLALVWYEVALLGAWDLRFGQFRDIVSIDYLHFLRGLDARGLDPAVAAYAATRLGVLAETVQPQRADLLVAIDWNTDATDVDLHVIEPTGEECYYGHRDTEIGGHMTSDVTQGYGPEMYTLAEAPAGEYAIGAHYFSSNTNRAGVRSKVHAVIYVGWGTPEERRVERVVTLVSTGDMHPIGLLPME